MEDTTCLQCLEQGTSTVHWLVLIVFQLQGCLKLSAGKMRRQLIFHQLGFYKVVYWQSAVGNQEVKSCPLIITAAEKCILIAKWLGGSFLQVKLHLLLIYSLCFKKAGTWTKEGMESVDGTTQQCLSDIWRRVPVARFPFRLPFVSNSILPILAYFPFNLECQLDLTFSCLVEFQICVCHASFFLFGSEIALYWLRIDDSVVGSSISGVLVLNLPAMARAPSRHGVSAQCRHFPLAGLTLWCLRV
ncbi:hypothetical protein MIR68_001377 [Amoeboaphelidium protococcarum]|nr:hypothetical protein MIR68_001377 [Amoeboaphelidium protococcarum]